MPNAIAPYATVRIAFSNAPASPSISSFVRFSVTATRIASASSGYHRLEGDPAVIAQPADFGQQP